MNWDDWINLSDTAKVAVLATLPSSSGRILTAAEHAAIWRAAADDMKDIRKDADRLKTVSTTKDVLESLCVLTERIARDYEAAAKETKP